MWGELATGQPISKNHPIVDKDALIVSHESE